MRRSFSIITASKGRLEHLRASLPTMLRQAGAEVIVVNYSCPEGSGEYVRNHFPLARVVSVEGEDQFSNWKARNAGAAAAGSDVLVFCDADTLLAEGALAWISDHLPPNAFGFLKSDTQAYLNTAGTSLAKNQLKGFQIVPSESFWRIGGYDEVLEGYAAGGDTDLMQRLRLVGLDAFAINAKLIVDSMIEHDKAERTRHHREPLSTSYCAGLLYRTAKLSLLRIRDELELPLEERSNLYEVARASARKLGPTRNTISMTVPVDTRPVRMAQPLGYEKGTEKVSLTVEVSFANKLKVIPE